MSMSQREPAVSVIMAVHNGGTYLHAAVQSILDQTYTDFEFIIVNDASTDESQAVLDSFSDDRIIVIKNKEKLGLTKSLSAGLTKARGIYIARMDADDVSLPKRLESQKAFLDTHPLVAMVGTAAHIIDAHNHQQGTKIPPSDTVLLTFHQLLKNQILHSSVMFRKKVIVEAGGYNEAMPFVQDYELWSRLMEHGLAIASIETPLICYRAHASSITQGAHKDKAYALAKQVVYTNISRYISCTPTDFALFIDTLHHHQVTSLRQARITRRTLAKFTDAFITQEKIGPKHSTPIRAYTARQRRGVFRWYARYRFGTLYTAIANVVRYFQHRA